MMKFKYINYENFSTLVPKGHNIDVKYFALSFEKYFGKIFEEHPHLYDGDCYKALNFNIFWESNSGEMSLHNSHGENTLPNVLPGYLILSFLRDHLNKQISIPINPMLKNYINIENTHSLYLHAFETEVPLYYFGVTKQNWGARYNQHLSNANCGSPYVFHSAIRKHHDKNKMHTLFATGLSYEDAMNLEEKFVSFTLYPLGLNMIPGGFAGLKYLHKLGISANSIKQRDMAVLELSKRENVNGNPNPLCAARWQSDQDFINRIICGHSGRLTVEEVNSIKRFNSFGFEKEYIKNIFPTVKDHQIENVLSGKRYSRIK